MSKRSFRLSESKPDPKRDVDDEIAFHLEMRAREFMEQGLSPEEAHRRAAAAFGNVPAIRSALHDERGARNQERQRRDWWNGLRMDVRYAVRSLRQNPAFAAAAVTTMALGIGATLAVFTVMNGVLIRPLPYSDPSRLTMVWMSEPSQGGGGGLPLSSGFFNDLAREAKSFEHIAAFRAWSYALTPKDGGESEMVAGAVVSPALFDVLGVPPFLGRGFGAEAAVPGGPREAVISHSLWQRRFSGDPSVVGSSITLSGRSFTVAGVMPRGFAFPRGAELPAPFQFGLRTDVWTPLVFDAADLRNYGSQNLAAIGRRDANVLFAQAQAEVSGIIQRTIAERNWRTQLDYQLVPMADQAARPVKRALLILLGAVVCLLLIACANVTSLLVARAGARQRELAVRAALGAGRGRIARQLITENVLLAVAGVTAGVVMSYWGTSAMLALVPGSLPRADDIGVDWRVLSFAAVVALAAGIAFGLASSHAVKWNRLTAELHAGGTRTTTGRGRRRGRQLLVIGEVALSLMLLTGAALLTRSFLRLQRIDPGFSSENVLVAQMSLPVAGRINPAADGPRWATVLNAATARMNEATGIAAAGAVSALPLSGAIEAGVMRIPGREPDAEGRLPHALYAVVSGAYFTAMQIRVVAGRPFDSSDDAPGAGSAIVNREFVLRYLEGDEASALGRTVDPTFTFTPGTAHNIVGVVENVKSVSLDGDPQPQIYLPQSQMAYPYLTIVVRTAGEPLAAVATLRRELRAVDPAITLKDIRRYDDVLAHSLARQRFSMTLIAVFAGCALVLALVGLYGVIALLVTQRKREIGVRLVLGARPVDVVRMVVLEGARVAIAGVALGVAGALALTRVLRTMLYDISPTDAATFVGAAGVMLAVSVTAAFVPARRAARADPASALRSD